MLEGTVSALLVTPATRSGSPAKSDSKSGTVNATTDSANNSGSNSSSSFSSSLTASTALRTPEELRANVLNDPNQPPPKLLSGDLLRASIDEERQQKAEEANPEKAGENASGKEEDQQSAETEQQESKDPRQLTEADLARIRQLTLTDTQTRLNEEAHVRVGGQYASSPAYDFETGPDNRQYAVSGEVTFNSTPIAGNPEATIRKLAVVKRAALAPAEPSPKDRAVATKATQGITQAQAQLRTDQLREEAKRASEQAQEELERNIAQKKAETEALTNPEKTEAQGPAQMTNTEVQFAGPTPESDGSITPQRSAAAFAATSRLQNSLDSSSDISSPTVPINVNVDVDIA